MSAVAQETTTDRSWVGCISEAAERLDGEGWDTLADAVRALDASHDRAEAEVERVTAERDRLAATVQAFEETHGNAAYLADNVAAVRIERDEFEAERDKARAELERLRADFADAAQEIARLGYERDRAHADLAASERSEDARLAIAQRALNEIVRMVGQFDTPRDVGRVRAVGDVGNVACKALGEPEKGW